MTEYKVVKGRIMHKGFIYGVGDVVELDDNQAEYLEQYISSNNRDNKQSKEESKDEVVDYEEYTIAELKNLVEEEDIDVKPTGKNGSAIKSDYIRALKASN